MGGVLSGEIVVWQTVGWIDPDWLYWINWFPFLGLWFVETCAWLYIAPVSWQKDTCLCVTVPLGAWLWEEEFCRRGGACTLGILMFLCSRTFKLQQPWCPHYCKIQLVCMYNNTQLVFWSRALNTCLLSSLLQLFSYRSAPHTVIFILFFVFKTRLSKNPNLPLIFPRLEVEVQHHPDENALPTLKHPWSLISALWLLHMTSVFSPFSPCHAFLFHFILFSGGEGVFGWSFGTQLVDHQAVFLLC